MLGEKAWIKTGGIREGLEKDFAQAYTCITDSDFFTDGQYGPHCEDGAMQENYFAIASHLYQKEAKDM